MMRSRRWIAKKLACLAFLISAATSFAAVASEDLFQLVDANQNSAMLVDESSILHKEGRTQYSTILIMEPSRIIEKGELPIRFVIVVWLADCDHKRLQMLMSQTFDPQKRLVHQVSKPAEYAIDAISEPPFTFACTGALAPKYSNVQPVPGRILLDGTIDGLRRSQQPPVSPGG
jgi:hypothetical protein